MHLPSLRDVPEGLIGKLQIYQSGNVKWVLLEIEYILLIIECMLLIIECMLLIIECMLV